MLRLGCLDRRRGPKGRRRLAGGASRSEAEMPSVPPDPVPPQDRAPKGRRRKPDRARPNASAVFLRPFGALGLRGASFRGLAPPAKCQRPFGPCPSSSRPATPDAPPRDRPYPDKTRGPKGRRRLAGGASPRTQCPHRTEPRRGDGENRIEYDQRRAQSSVGRGLFATGFSRWQTLRSGHHRLKPVANAWKECENRRQKASRLAGRLAFWRRCCSFTDRPYTWRTTATAGRIRYRRVKSY